MTLFDANTFGQMSFTESNSTESVPVPVGEWPATIGDKKIDTWAAKDGSSSGLKMYVYWDIEDPAVREVTGREKSRVRQEFMFDLVEGTGALDFGKGKNVRLGRLREATGLNTPGQAFSFDMLVGRMAKVNVKHRPDNRDASILYAEVTDAARM